ncbi:hypothetical protein O0S10_07120 [Methanocorpusculum sp. MG]|uniref:Winged helix-turn-helix transcriptional regulator n=1 Tax=Methanocorpusculum petauri TaxID=3002863 RepID=A0ABT4IGX1_9EURY|nr:winged helix-turn-helix transcriptional regulator [Methanocorpusculum petauri]MCZ0860995.1 hypothetical protein [Methanocorpusculum petauri]
MERELLHEIGIVLLVILVLFSAAVVLFFAEGGEIYGFNHDPDNPTVSLEHNKYEFEIVDEEIVPIYDGTEIKTVELWELPPKEILRQLITEPMAYIPPITAHLTTLFISALGLTFIVLYRRKDSWESWQEGNRPEQILTFIKEYPGYSLQMIADNLGIHRSTLRYYLRNMKKKDMISATDYQGHLHYFAGGKLYTDTEKLMYSVFSREKEKLAVVALWNHSGCTKQELAELLHLTPNDIDWYLRRFLEDGLIMIVSDGSRNSYRLTDEAADACRKIVAEQKKTADSGQ